METLVQTCNGALAPGRCWREERLEGLSRGALSFWFLNHELEETELERQLRELKAKGFGGVFLHPRGGLRVPYGSARWYEVIAFCLEKAREIGLEAWLYDEDPYPSGAAGGRVMLEHPELAATYLVPTLMEVREAGRAVLDLAPGALVAAYHGRGGALTRIDASAGLVRTQWRQTFSNASYYPPYYSEGGPHWRAETGGVHYRVEVEEAQPGDWILGVTREEASQNPWGRYPDLLNPASVEAFLSMTHRPYAERTRSVSRSVMPGIFTDEAKLRGNFPWSAGVPAAFEAVCGLALMEELPHLFVSLTSKTPLIRWAYRQALAELLREAFFEPLREGCHAASLLLTGHISPEEDPMAQVHFAPGLMGILGRFDLPGCDLIGSALGGEERPLLHLSPKMAASAAHGAGHSQVMCEAFAVADWSQSLADLQRAFFWLYGLGVNRLVLHGQFYSIDGLRKREAPPSQFFQAAYWEHFGAFTQVVEWLSEAMESGEHEAPVLLYYPEETFMALGAGAEAEAMRERFGVLIDRLLVAGYDFDLVDADLLAKATALPGGGWALGEERFAALVVPGRYVTEGTWRHLEGRAAVLWMEPEVVVLREEPQEMKVEAVVEVVAALDRAARPLWRTMAGRLIGHQRRVEGEALLLLVNNDMEAFAGEVVLSFEGPYEGCDPARRVWERLPGRYLEIPAGGARLIRRSRGAGGRPVGEGRLATVEWEEWEISAQGANTLVLSEFRWLAATTGEEPPDARLFQQAGVVDLLSPTVLQVPAPAGDRWLWSSFEWRGEPGAALDLVRDGELAAGEEPMAFYLNGVLLPAFERKRVYDPENRVLTITPWLRRGRNELLWLQRTGGAAHPWPFDGLRLFGAFEVEFPFGRPIPARLSPRPESYRRAEALPPERLGHPHYGGLMRYRRCFYWSESVGRRVALRLGQVRESVAVFLNGKAQGVLWSEPYCLEVEGIVPGWNVLELEVACSAANYLQALGRPGGFDGPVEWLVG